MEIWWHQIAIRHEENGFPIVILRPTGVYGPEDIYITRSTLQAVRAGRLRFLPGDGNRFVHFTYIDDVVQGFIRALDAGLSAVGETFIVASDDYRTYKDIFAIIIDLLNAPRPRIGLPPALVKRFVRLIEWYNHLRGIDDFVMHASLIDDMLQDRAYSNFKAKNHLGFQPAYEYHEGMQITVERFYRSEMV